MYISIFVCMDMYVYYYESVKENRGSSPQLLYYLSPFLVCSCDKELKGISMLTQPEQDSSLQRPASFSQPAVFETSELQR